MRPIRSADLTGLGFSAGMVHQYREKGDKGGEEE